MTDPYVHLRNVITTFPSRIHTNSPRLLQKQVPTFRGTKDIFNEFGQLLKKPIVTQELHTARRRETSVLIKSPQRESKRFFSITNDRSRDEFKRSANEIPQTIKTG